MYPHVDNLLPCRGLLWVVVANLLLQEAHVINQTAMDPFLLHNILQLLWSVHFFRRRITADTRLEVFADNVTHSSSPYGG